MSARLDRKRLAQVLGMMGSSQPGEALNAARVAAKMQRDSGKTWEQLLTPIEIKLPEQPSSTPTPEPAPEPPMPEMHGHVAVKAAMLSFLLVMGTVIGTAVAWFNVIHH